MIFRLSRSKAFSLSWGRVGRCSLKSRYFWRLCKNHGSRSFVVEDIRCQKRQWRSQKSFWCTADIVFRFFLHASFLTRKKCFEMLGAVGFMSYTYKQKLGFVQLVNKNQKSLKQNSRKFYWVRQESNEHVNVNGNTSFFLNSTRTLKTLQRFWKFSIWPHQDAVA